MHVIGTILARWAARKACSWIAGRAAGSDGFDVTASYSHDDGYLTARLALDREVPGLNAAVNILTPSDVYVKGIGDYQDSDGDFSHIQPFDGRECVCRVPLHALVYRAAGDYRLRVTCFMPKGGNGKPEIKDRKTFRITLPEPRRLGRAACCLPLAELMRHVVQASDTGRAARSRCMKELLVDSIGMSEREYDTLHESVRNVSQSQFPAILEGIRRSIPSLKTESLIAMLLQIALSDDDFSADEESIVREVARLRGMTDGEWERFAESKGLNRLSPWAMLGLRRGATPDEIRTAYRQIMQQYHPDRFAQSPKEFQELATKKTIAARQAYEQLMNRGANA